MKKLILITTILTASVLLNAVLALSNSGPFGMIGPPDYTDSGKGAVSDRISDARGTGPYGAFVIIGAEPGVVVSKRLATQGGSGPYGTFDISGMILKDRSMSRDECIMVAKNCTPDR